MTAAARVTAALTPDGSRERRLDIGRCLDAATRELARRERQAPAEMARGRMGEAQAGAWVAEMAEVVRLVAWCQANRAVIAKAMLERRTELEHALRHPAARAVMEAWPDAEAGLAETD